jgi:hypothetical protein
VTRSFVRSSLYMTAGLLAWGAAFLVTYGFAAIACARQFAGRLVLGLPLVHAVIAIATLVTGGAAIAVILHARRDLHRHASQTSRVGSGSRAGAESRRLQASVALATAVLGLIAILWNGIAALLVPACDPPAVGETLHRPAFCLGRQSFVMET